jgi:hypothetical protein
MDRTHSRAARPGVFSDSLDSSLTVRQVSQPQNANIDPDRPAMNADRVSPDGLNQSKLNEIPVSEEPDFANATTAKINSTAIWKPTKMYWTYSVVVIPLEDTQVATARKARQVRTFTPRFCQRVPTSSLPTNSPRNW